MLGDRIPAHSRVTYMPASWGVASTPRRATVTYGKPFGWGRGDGHTVARCAEDTAHDGAGVTGEAHLLPLRAPVCVCTHTQIGNR